MPTIATSTSTIPLGAVCQRVVELIPAGAYLAAIYEGSGTGKVVCRRRVGGAWSAACGSSGPNGDGTLTASRAALCREGSDVHVLVETSAIECNLKYIRATWNGSDDWELGESMLTIAGTGMIPASSITIAKDPQENEYIAAGSYVNTTKTYVSTSPETAWGASDTFGDIEPTLVVWAGKIYLFTTNPTSKSVCVRERVNGVWSSPHDIVVGLEQAVGTDYSVAATEDRLHLFYHEKSVGGDTLVHMHSTVPQSAWSGKIHVDEGATATLYQPNLASLDGDLVAVWRYHAQANEDAVRACRRRGSNWRTPVTTAPGSEDDGASQRLYPHLPPVLHDGDREFQVLYRKGTESPYDVVAATFGLAALLPRGTYASRNRRTRR